eukprot:CAMPEP_0172610528 /NCGR_PEP_ID=MMETSP1068-20121228/30328_1 /TAXON_ID=35684 /ORGANISM="Pseudopedinella elastica, Strain CCMP716" /LENGTH=99 /DNA_ID=CAMNT_0013414265 /DNA_START=366 /DNA_END=665 /DNA_ORIENTATION=+
MTDQEERRDPWYWNMGLSTKISDRAKRNQETSWPKSCTYSGAAGAGAISTANIAAWARLVISTPSASRLHASSDSIRNTTRRPCKLTEEEPAKLKSWPA